MNMLRNRYCAAFADKRLVASGDIADVARTTKGFIDNDPSLSILIFDDDSELVEIDFRGTQESVVERIREAQQKLRSEERQQGDQMREGNLSHLEAGNAKSEVKSDEAKAGPGRPKLGVVSKEVTLLPRHWEWLATQSGGASVTIRKLVDAARKQDEVPNREKRSREITYKFMSAMAGNEVNFEEASRALFAGDAKRFEELISVWPADLREHIRHLSTTAGS